MIQAMTQDDSQEAFTIEESKTTFTDTGNTISSVRIKIGETTYHFSKHSCAKEETVGIHDIGNTPITVFRQKVSKRTTKMSCGTQWTVIQKVD